MALFEQSPSRSGSRFGKLSSNMFFTRNTAKPKRVKHIEGLNGTLICSVNDDPTLVRSTPTSSLSFNGTSSLSFNGTSLPTFKNSRRVERLLPPTGFWSTSGVIQDTDRWRNELVSLATASGLGIEKEEQKYNNKPPPTTADQQNASRSGAHYSTRTGRFNEGTSKSRGRTGSKHGHSDMLFNISENERELWMLQVLCQLLGTSNLTDVQSWLVSASPTEKEQARKMINSALQGLKESERTTTPNSSVDLDSLSNFVEKQKNEEKQASQKYVKESLNRPLTVLQSINEEQQTDKILDDSWKNLAKNNSTTYQSSFQNYNRHSFSSFDTRNNKNDKQIDTIQLHDDDDQQQRPRSASLTKSPKLQTSLKRSESTHQIESLQINDDDELILPPIKTKQLSDKDDNAKSRKIRELQNKLSRQEEEAKKQLNELQSKQSRLENALKLLVKQTSKGRQQSSDDIENKNTKEDLDALDRRYLEKTSSDNRPTRSFSGIWKPDASTLHRLQGN